MRLSQAAELAAALKPLPSLWRKHTLPVLHASSGRTLGKSEPEQPRFSAPFNGPFALIRHDSTQQPSVEHNVMAAAAPAGALLLSESKCRQQPRHSARLAAERAVAQSMAPPLRLVAQKRGGGGRARRLRPGCTARAAARKRPTLSRPDLAGLSWRERERGEGKEGDGGDGREREKDDDGEDAVGIIGLLCYFTYLYSY
eukprot:scaffold123805_cov24-Tisochrysis_lutea.AAC.2